MSNEHDRTHAASRVILATPRTLFRAFIDAEAMASWRAPEGRTAFLRGFDPRVGGGYRMLLTSGPEASGATGEAIDEVEARFVELLAEEKVTERISFLSADPALRGEMLLISSFTPVADGTRVTMTAERVPPGIDRESHEAAMASTLRQLARLTE